MALLCLAVFLTLHCSVFADMPQILYNPHKWLSVPRQVCEHLRLLPRMP